MSDSKNGPWQKTLGALQRMRLDGWKNTLTGIGVQGRDKRLGAEFQVDALAQITLEQIRQGDDIAARIVEAIPREMLRKGYETIVEESPEIAKAMDTRLEDMAVNGSARRALEFERNFGGSAIILGVDDGAKDWSIPLNEKNIKSFRWLRVLTPDELQPVAWQTKINEPDFGEPNVYRISPLGLPPGATPEEYPLIHTSRMIRLEGIRTTNRNRAGNRYWGDSVLLRCMQVIADFQAAWSGAFTLMQDFSTPVVKFKGLAQLVSQKDGALKLKNRLAAIEQARSIINAMIIDADGEGYERQNTPLSGLSDLLEQAMYRLCLAADMPVSLLMGKAPSGLSGDAAGASDMQQFYDRVSSMQIEKLLPILKRIMKLLFLSKDGPTSGKVPPEWGVEFCPLWELTELEQATLRKTQAETDAIYVEAQVLAAEEVRKSRWGGAEYSTQTTLDGAAFDEMKQAEEDAAQAELDAQNAKVQTSAPAAE